MYIYIYIYITYDIICRCICICIYVCIDLSRKIGRGARGNDVPGDPPRARVGQKGGVLA